ncbi:isoprenylcysteine carboxylmethyltransferase family protein [Desulfovibrio sp. JC010]|uniref:methyltransferase family protein n=1 Tax=Desulfovibrio sp. JC010 TaxID=2593641 RepID=UPI0013D6B50E|nr:isoprenylcysteine carboxylmethyltransferase family protein [Desulfovibrio sp. JC010]NDV25234.1 isoprenylcysteine carboxylmethyltransferase family protein [Desulfovibrio sp. JC010]
MKFYPLPPILFFFSVFMIVIASMADITPISRPDYLKWTGWFLIVTGTVFCYSGSILFSRQKANIDTFKDPNKLVVSGPFRVSRNPMYVGMVAALLGTSLAAATYVGIAFLLLFVMIVATVYIPFEEGRMLAVFGREYEEYCLKVRRWL